MMQCKTCPRWRQHQDDSGLCHRWGALVPTAPDDYCSAHPGRQVFDYEAEELSTAIDAWGTSVIDDGWTSCKDDADVQFAILELYRRVRAGSFVIEDRER